MLYEEAGNEISSSYATGAVSGSDSGGGFVCNFGVRNYDSDYWDTTTSGTTYGLCDNDNYSAITGLTTQQLQKKLPAGFSKKIWALNPKINNGFPYLIANPPRNHSGAPLPHALRGQAMLASGAFAWACAAGPRGTPGGRRVAWISHRGKPCCSRFDCP